ncbi:Prolyl-tRNA synthetase associated domain-containing protein 1 [Amphibalanus amphitrite]|uniref:PrdX deacylase domain-containing protein 1 n=1 Tax=Amphibalanus amphitrite TaxID=1232801 RepID=A0A6A4W849_AMPAM|nr:Prolyl-tRNA synthetase associated domain-containing protein 1 [Amphibalanus amphitrite]
MVRSNYLACLQQTAGASGAELAQLERRQEAILSKLMQLRCRVEEAVRQRSARSAPGQEVCAVVATDACLPLDHRAELVVVASADRPPCSLLLLRLLAPTVTLTAHVHSTCPAVPPHLLDAFRWRGAAGGAHIRLIWKPEVGEPRLLVSPAGQGCPLVGEEQLFRYLARALLPEQYEAAGAERAALIDLHLERADRLMNGSGAEKKAVLGTLDGLLGRQPFLLGGQLALIDGVLLSALRCSKVPPAPTSVAAWRDRVSIAAGLAAAGGAGATGGAGTPPAPGDGGGHLDQARLMALLSELDIRAETVTHPAVFTVEAMMPHLAAVRGAVTKNLFLRDRRRRLFLLTARHDAQFRLADVARQLDGAKELRFGDESELAARLGVRQGCVTPLAVANDTERAVTLLVDAKLLDGSVELLWCHPLTNEASTGLSPAEFRRFAAATGHEPTLISV